MADDDQGDANGRCRSAESCGLPARASLMTTSNVIDFTSIPPAAGFEKLEEWAAEVARLAALPELGIRARAQGRGEAPRHLRMSVLDKAREAGPPEGRGGEAPGQRGSCCPRWSRGPIPSTAPSCSTRSWPSCGGSWSPTSHQLIASALWIVHTHCFEAWWISPKLLVKSATKRCGKTRVFEVIERLVRAAVAGLGEHLLVGVPRDRGEPRRAADAAHGRGRRADQERRRHAQADQRRAAERGRRGVMISVPCGDGWESRQFSTWAPIALAGIGDQAGTIHDRSVIITMRRKTVDQHVEKLRGNKDYGFHELARKCARWAADHVEDLKDAEPAHARDAPRPRAGQLGAADRDRRRRGRRLAAARAEGGRSRSRREAEEFDAAEVGVQLLHDIADVFEGGLPGPRPDATGREIPDRQRMVRDDPDRRVTTGYLLARLHEMGERIWSTYGKGGAPLSGYDLAALLRQFEVRSRQLKFTIDGKEYNWKGYEADQFVHLLLQYPQSARYPATFRRNPGGSRDQALSSARRPR